MSTASKFEWNDDEKQFKPIGWKPQLITQKGDRIMSDTQKSEVKVYELTRKGGRVDKIRFTGKREQILNMMKEGKSNEEIVAAGFSKNTVLVVRWQGKTLGILTSTATEEPSTEQ